MAGPAPFCKGAGGQNWLSGDGISSVFSPGWSNDLTTPQALALEDIQFQWAPLSGDGDLLSPTGLAFGERWLDAPPSSPHAPPSSPLTPPNSPHAPPNSSHAPPPEPSRRSLGQVMSITASPGPRVTPLTDHAHQKPRPQQISAHWKPRPVPAPTAIVLRMHCGPAAGQSEACGQRGRSSRGGARGTQTAQFPREVPARGHLRACVCGSPGGHTTDTSMDTDMVTPTGTSMGTSMDMPGSHHGHPRTPPWTHQSHTTDTSMDTDMVTPTGTSMDTPGHLYGHATVTPWTPTDTPTDNPTDTHGYPHGHPHRHLYGHATVERKEAAGMVSGSNAEGGRLPSAHTEEEDDDPADCPHKDTNPMVICQLKGGTQMLCIDHSGTRELKALHLLPQYQDQNNSLQSDVPKPMTALVGRFLPVPAKLNLITQQPPGQKPLVGLVVLGLTPPPPEAEPCEQLENGPVPPGVSGPLQGPPLTLTGVEGLPPTPRHRPLRMETTTKKAHQFPFPSRQACQYCDCFASGDFCNDCNCNNYCNNLRHELERFKAIKAYLDRNPEAFQPKIGSRRLGDVKLRHGLGCDCRSWGCLKGHCECYEAKMMCSSICKCVGCKNYEDSPEQVTLMSLPADVELGALEGSPHLSPAKSSGPPRPRRDRPSFTCISWEVVEAACACLLAQGEEAEREHCSQCLAEQRVLEEFGRCLSQILHIEFKSRGLQME
ncbi:PREDICTED: mucin-2-like [Elephantulus edwardii]|uniref:mucin-2-like n=1 Tax=Elephantulus edwardii TaxID=28737 RepID=UPI0003F09EEC|nr:PREDICTED: mucin-2-like [Elephantulus edwardii]